MIWVKYKSGVIWGHRGQKVIFSKNATSATEYMVLSALCNIVYPCYHVTHKYALTWDSQLHSLVQGQLGITSADRVRRLWRQHVSSSLSCRRSRRILFSSRFFFFLLSSFFLLLATLLRLIASTCLDRFQLNLVTRTPDPWHLCHMTRVGSKVT